MRRVCAIIAVATALQGLCETVKTASQPWVTNYVAQAVAGISAPTNVYTKTEVDAKLAEVSAPTITTTTDGQTRRERGHVVYSNVMLFIREVPAANGERKYRLIRREE